MSERYGKDPKKQMGDQNVCEKYGEGGNLCCRYVIVNPTQA